MFLNVQRVPNYQSIVVRIVRPRVVKELCDRTTDNASHALSVVLHCHYGITNTLSHQHNYPHQKKKLLSDKPHKRIFIEIVEFAVVIVIILRTMLCQRPPLSSVNLSPIYFVALAAQAILVTLVSGHTFSVFDFGTTLVASNVLQRIFSRLACF